MIKDADIPLNIRVHVSEKNLTGLEELFDEIHSLGFGRKSKIGFTAAPVVATSICPIYPSRCTETSEAVRVVSMAWEAAKRNNIMLSGLPNPPYEMLPCPYVTPTSVVVDPYGTFYTCLMAASERKGVAGSVEEGSYVTPVKTEMWHKECSECHLLTLCGGGCTWRHESTGGTCAGIYDFITERVKFFLRSEHPVVE